MSKMAQSSSTKILDDFRLALQKLLSEECFKTLTTELDKSSKLGDQVVELEKQMHDMKGKHKEKVQKMESDHDTANQQFSRAYHKDLKEHLDEISGLTRTIKDREDQLLERQSSYETQSNRIKILETKVNEMSLELQEKNKIIDKAEKETKGLHDKIRARGENISSLERYLQDQKDRYDELENSRNSLIKAKDSDAKQLQAATKELKKIKSLYSNEVHSNEPKTDVFERLYKSFFDIVMTFFDQDLSENTIHGPRALSKFVQDAKLRTQIPILQSNKPPAKFMRGVVLLASIASRLYEQFFLPFYHSNASSMRETLADEAETNPDRELLCRVLLLSMASDEQDDNTQECISRAVKDITDLVEKLLPEKVPAFTERLRPVIQEALEVWRHVQRCKLKVEADIDTDTDPSWPWRTVEDFSEDPNGDGQGTQNDVVLCLFPRIYIIAKDEIKPIFPGVVLRKWQLRSAEEQVRNAIASDSTLPPSPKSRRRMSLGAARPLINQTNGEKSFLVSGPV